MLCTKRPKECDGRGECYRRYTKYYYYQHDDVICTHNCELKPCSGCKFPYPQWHYDLFSSGQCYDCNKLIHESEIDSAEEELRSDASLDSGGSVDEDDRGSWEEFRPYTRQEEEEEQQEPHE